MTSKGLQLGKVAPDFSLEATTGGKLSLADFNNQPVILLFLRGTW